jgi:hypothetical protein
MPLIILEQRGQECNKKELEGKDNMTSAEKAIIDKFKLLLFKRVS